jgi:hypothetical protein
MVRFASRDDRFALVGVNSGPKPDFARSVERIRQLAKLANRADAVATLVIIVDHDAEHPSAMWRKRLIDARAEIKRSRFALVTASSVARGIFHLIEWMTPARPGCTLAAFRSFADAVRWAEKDAGCALPFLAELYDEARRANDDGPP